MAKTQEILYAFVGAGDFAIEKVRNLPKIVDSKTSEKLYKDFVKRGRSLSTKIKSSAPTKQAVAQTKTARTQIKAAATSIRKAVDAGALSSSNKASEETKVARAQVKAAATSVTKAARANAKATRAAAQKAIKVS